MVRLVIRHAETVKADSHCFENFVEVLVVALGDFTRRDLFRFCGYDDRGSVVVRSADKHDVLSQPAEISDIEVSRDIGAEVS